MTSVWWRALLVLALGACSAKNPDFCEIDADCGDGAQCSVETHTCVTTSLTLDPTGFFDDGERWFTAESGPLLRGTLDPVQAPVIHAFVGTTLVGPAATIDGTTWSLQLPEGTITRDDVPLHVQLFGDGRTTEIVQTFALDDEPPAVEVGESEFHDERGDAIDFSTGVPVHDHAGEIVALNGSGCPAVFKHAYLMDDEIPFGAETAPNPVAWSFHVTERAAIDLAASTYVVHSLDGSIVTDAFAIGSELVPGGDVVITVHRRGAQAIEALGTTAGQFQLEARFVDWAGHAAEPVTVCWDHHPLAAPLDVDAAHDAADHARALDAIGLGGEPFQTVAIRLLNTTAGASLTDLPFANDTAEPIALAIDVSSATVTTTQSFALRNFVSSTAEVSIDCGPTGTPDPELFKNCDPPDEPATFTALEHTQTAAANVVSKVFELDAAGAPSTEIVCAPCVVNGRSVFTIPPREIGQPARRYVAMTLLTQVTGLFPVDVNHLGFPPFSDFSLGGVKLTGDKDASITGCTRTEFIVQGTREKCAERTTLIPYRALTTAELAFPGGVPTSYSIAVNPAVEPEPLATGLRTSGWSTAEGALP